MFSELVSAVETGRFTKLSDDEAILLFGRAFSTDLARLRNAPPAAECRSNQPHPTPSKLIYSTDYDEVNRALVSLLTVKWLLADDYTSFTACQHIPAIKLTRASFTQLRGLLLEAVPAPADTLTLLASLIINDLGKDPTLSTLLPACSPATNHDEIVYIAAERNLLPTFNTLTSLYPHTRAPLLLGLKLGRTLNIAQFAQAENVPVSLQAATLCAGEPHAFNLKFMELLLDVAGAQAHVECRGSQLIEPVFQNFFSAREALQNLIHSRGTLRSNYDLLLSKRATLLKSQGFRQLSLEPADRALLRLLAMARIAEPKGAGVFERAFTTLPAATKDALVAGLSVDGTDDGIAVIPYYMPALFVAGLRNVDPKNGEEGQVRAVQSLMRFLVRVYKGSKPVPGAKECGAVERNVGFAKETVLGEGFKKDPAVLDGLKIKEE